MKKVGLALMSWVVLGSLVVLAQSQPPPPERPAPPPPSEQLRQMELQERQMSLEAREQKALFEREMDKLALEQRRLDLERQKQASSGRPFSPRSGHGCQHGAAGAALLLLVLAVHILVAVWVHQDVRRRKSDSGIWVAIVLISGLIGTAVYALVRLGDKSAGNQAA